MNDVAEKFGSILTDICTLRDYEVRGQEVMPDHVHLFLSIPPSDSVADAVKVLKGTSARTLFMSYPALREQLWGGHLWNPSYYVGSAGEVSAEVITRYIEQQKQHASSDD